MNTFDYQRPSSVAEAARLAGASDDARVLAGGQSLIASMKLGLIEPACLVDLGRIADLRGVRLDGATLTIGAMTTHAEVAASAEVRRALPALAALAEGIGDRAVRSRGTLGGSIAHNDPAADWPAAVLGLGATVHTDRRTVAADDFFRGLYETALQPGEIVTAVAFPLPKKAGYMKFRQPASRFAIVGVFVSSGPAGTRVAVTGAGPCVWRATTLEAALAKHWSPAACDGVAIAEDGLNGDLHATPRFRAHLVGVMAKRAVLQAG